MPTYHVVIESFDKNIDADDEDDVISKAKDNLYITVTKIADDKPAEPECLHVETRDGVSFLTDSDHVILFTRTLPAYFDILGKLKPVDASIIKDAIASKDNDITRAGESSFATSRLKIAFDYLVPGLNGDEKIDMLVGKNTPLFVRIDDEWLLVAPCIE